MQPNGKVAEAGKKWVRKHYKRRGESLRDGFDQEEIEVRTFDVEPARVHANMGMKVNLGNYESLDLGVGVSLPCYIEEIPEATQQVWEMVEAELFKKVNEAKASLGRGE